MNFLVSVVNAIVIAEEVEGQNVQLAVGTMEARVLTGGATRVCQIATSALERGLEGVAVAEEAMVISHVEQIK